MFVLTEDVSNGIRKVVLNRPDKRNALSNSLRKQLFSALEKADNDKSVKVIIISGSYLDTELNGILLTLESFNRLFYGLGDIFLVFMVSVFGITTLFTYSYYGVKCLDFLTKKKYGFIYNYIYLTSIFFSAISSVNFVISLIDLSFALMAIPNMISVIYLSKLVKQEITKTNSLEAQ